MQGKSPPVQVKEPYCNSDMVTCRLSYCNPHTARIAMYFKGVLQDHNVLVLEYVTLETCMQSNLVGLHAYISSSSTSLF